MFDADCIACYRLRSRREILVSIHNSPVRYIWWPRNRYCKDNEFAANPQELIDLGELVKPKYINQILTDRWPILFRIVDENTILVCAILGTTYTGQYEDVKEMDRLLGEKNEAEGLSVYIHVDGASGGFVAPFANPELEWDFRLVRTLYCRYDCRCTLANFRTVRSASCVLYQRQWTQVYVYRGSCLSRLHLQNF